MAKAQKARKIPKKHLYSRISFLHQAANSILQQRSTGCSHSSDQGVREVGDSSNSTVLATSSSPVKASGLGISQMMIMHLQAVSRKGQIRLAPELKHTMCKRCNTLLIPGKTSKTEVENKSRNRKKPWADVLVIECLQCKAQKRFPIGAERQPKKVQRQRDGKEDIRKAPPSATNSNTTLPQALEAQADAGSKVVIENHVP